MWPKQGLSLTLLSSYWNMWWKYLKLKKQEEDEEVEARTTSAASVQSTSAYIVIIIHSNTLFGIRFTHIPTTSYLYN